MVVYRALDEDQRSSFSEYTSYAFSPESGPGKYELDEDDFGRMEMGSLRGVFDEGEPSDTDPLCVCRHYWLEAVVRGEWHPTAGLAAIATPPEHRRSGYVAGLLSASLEEYCSRGERFALLWPFRYRFYRRFGWETCAHHYSYQCDPSALSFARAIINDKGTFRQLEANDYGLIEPVYGAYADRYSLSLGRDEDWWRHRIFSTWGTDPYAYVWEREGVPRGYLFYSIQGDWGDRTFQVHDLAFHDHEALMALLAFCSNHDSQAEKVQFELPTDVEIIDLSNDPEKFECELGAGVMARIVNVTPTLEALDYPAVDEEVTLSVEDSLADWNNETFRLVVHDGEATCEALSSGTDADLTLDIATLTQLVVGFHSVWDLYRQNRLHASVTVVEALDRLFPRESAYLGTRF